jgi:hypothetical protein
MNWSPKCRRLSKYPHYCSQQVKQFEAEVKETIESYRQILANNNTLSMMRSGQNSCQGLDTITKEKMKLLKS